MTIRPSVHPQLQGKPTHHDPACANVGAFGALRQDHLQPPSPPRPHEYHRPAIQYP
ncbi:hypothetical protein BGZ61DRAFT_437278 [Ilyonectria robusta]|uniref:uncharacterized protein n=1 Tax=Ilyonectria robusta TaxID=1079257 RepID=UPI001E8CD767|nr:uncharacterized protein BGZ61DRAFT_437278 [Ilyonectria robusta]KAH8736914.1 hypothetical protein BGZ61DRAFT_437278 [Ilyonectria robusta]